MTGQNDQRMTLENQTGQGLIKDYWRQRIAIQLQLCNANVLLKKISNLSGQAKCPDL